MKQVNYKTKNKILLGIGLLLLLIVYQLAIKKSIAAFSLNSSLKQQIEKAAGAPQKLALLEQQNLAYDAILANYKGNGSNTQQLLLSAVTGYCQENNLLLKEFPKSIFKQESEYLVETNYFVLEGGFINTLRLIHHLEQKNRIGKIASVNYQVKKDQRTQKDFLNATIYIQNVKKQSNEEV